MAISFVQSPVPPALTSATSYAQAYGSNNTAGNFLVVMTIVGSSTTVPTISDTQGNSWTPTPLQRYAANTIQLWYVTSCKGGANTVAVQINQAAASGSIILAEYSGINTIDKTSQATGSSTSLNSGSVTTTVANELLVGMLASNAGGVSAIAVGAGTTNTRQNIANAVFLADSIVSSTGTSAATATDINGAWAASIFTFFQGSGGAGWLNRERKFINKR